MKKEGRKEGRKGEKPSLYLVYISRSYATICGRDAVTVVAKAEVIVIRSSRTSILLLLLLLLLTHQQTSVSLPLPAAGRCYHHKSHHQ